MGKSTIKHHFQWVNQLFRLGPLTNVLPVSEASAASTVEQPVGGGSPMTIAWFIMENPKMDDN